MKKFLTKERIQYNAPVLVCLIFIVILFFLPTGYQEIYREAEQCVAEVLETYSYQVGLKEGRYSFATAVGLFQSLVGLIMIFGSNALSKRMGAADCGDQ